MIDTPVPPGPDPEDDMPPMSNHDDTPTHPTFGDARVDTVLQRLDELSELPVEDHPQVYAAIHGRLREVLSGLDADADDGPP